MINYQGIRLIVNLYNLKGRFVRKRIQKLKKLKKKII